MKRTPVSYRDTCTPNLHAFGRMEFETFAASGRLSEILGPGIGYVYLKRDREMRRLGMVYGAEKTLEEINKDSVTKRDCDAYTAGVNEYIKNLKESELPLEYKLLNYRPEPWTNLKIALFMKNMAYDLAGADEDMELTNAKSLFSKEDFAKLYPSLQDSVDPIVPKGTAFMPASVHLHVPVSANTSYFNNIDTVTVREFKPEKDNGSNDWAVSGKKTLSGRPILYNDPHLATNLPSIWYEMQIQTPEFNTYGVSFPGTPYIIIGFNDSCAWGVTNSERDVRDYYKIRFRNFRRQEYRYNGEWKQVDQRIETIKVKGQPDFLDTVAYTVYWFRCSTIRVLPEPPICPPANPMPCIGRLTTPPMSWRHSAIFAPPKTTTITNRRDRPLFGHAWHRISYLLPNRAISRSGSRASFPRNGRGRASSSCPVRIVPICGRTIFPRMKILI